MGFGEWPPKPEITEVWFLGSVYLSSPPYSHVGTSLKKANEKVSRTTTGAGDTDSTISIQCDELPFSG